MTGTLNIDGDFAERWEKLERDEEFNAAISNLRDALLKPGSLQHALAVAARGWAGFPVVGKVPTRGSNGFNDAATDESTLRDLWSRQGVGATGVGIRTGAASGFWALDVDVVDDKGGDDSLAELEAIHGRLPETVESVTGTGGRHIFFTHDPRVGSSARKLAPGLDVRADGGYIVAPDSIHPNGVPYRWEVEHHPDDVPIVSAPEWLIALLTKPEIRTPVTAGELAEMIDQMLSAGWTEIRKHDGERNFARPGKRHVGATLYPFNTSWPDGRLMVWTTSTDIPPGLYGHKVEYDKIAADMISPIEAELAAEKATWITGGPAGMVPAPSNGTAGRTGPPPAVRSFDSIPSETVSWLWDGRIPYGKLFILEGEPGVSKSTLTCDLAARVSTGTPPPGEPLKSSEPQHVVMLTAEDGAGDTIKPRLISHGARLDRVHTWDGPMIHGPNGWEARFPSFPSNASDLEKIIVEKDAKLVIIDPMSAFYDGDIQTNNDASVRRALAPLTDMAQRTGAAIVIVRHLNKDTGKSAMNRGGGSVGIIGAARAAMVAAKDPNDDDRRILAAVKMNLARMPRKSLAYFVEDDATNACPHIRWDGEVDITADELLSAQNGKGEPTAVDDAADWLRDHLAAGPQASEKVKNAGQIAGHAWRTVRRASDQVGVRKKNSGPGTPWVWSLGGDDDAVKVDDVV